MQIQSRHLILAFIALLTFLPTAMRETAFSQVENNVNLRTTAPPARPGYVAAIVTVNRNRVRVGEWVRVSLAAPAGAKRPRFSVSFGDGKEQVTRSTPIDHKYDKVGHYDIYAWVPVETPPPIPLVLLSVDPNPAAVERPLTFNAKLTFNYPDINYRFVFGDGKQTVWQDQSQTTHAYALPRTYQAYVDIGAEENGSIKPLRGSARQAIRVTAPQPVSVYLSAEPTTVAVGQRVTFNARANSRDSNREYQFVFGDGSASDWQSGSQATHEYASPKTYLAYVQIRSNSSSGPVISSARQPIRVIAPQPVSVNLTVEPTTVKTGTPVTFTALADPSDRNVSYRFHYGDGAFSVWQVSPQSRHQYSVANTYFAYVEAALSNNNQRTGVVATSEKRLVSVTSLPPPTLTPTPTPTPTPTSTPAATPAVSPASSPGSSPTPPPGFVVSTSPVVSPGPSNEPSPAPNLYDKGNWWKYLLIALLIILVSYRTFRFLFVPRPTFRPVRDAGSSAVDEKTNALAINAQVLLRPDIADGDYRVSTDEPNLIRSVRREHD